ncbi:MAG: hypothetical protein LBR33_09425, partial [Propionibacteriaceae bacterium]|nr:hypothetical protein [Propionibacteriaceae bacterium]
MKIYQLVADQVTMSDDRSSIGLARGARSLRLGPLPPAIVDGLDGLVSEPCSDTALSRRVIGAGQPSDLAVLAALLTGLWRAGWLRLTVQGSNGPLIVADPLLPRAGGLSSGVGRPRLSAQKNLRLARDIVLTTEGQTLVVESGSSLMRVGLHDPAAAALVASLVQPVDGGDLLATLSTTDQGDDLAAVVETLLDVGLVVAGSDSADDSRYWSS